MTEYLYRVTEQAYSAGIDEYGDPIPGGPTLPNLETYLIIKRTPCGAWIPSLHNYNGKRFVNLTSTKQFACTTVQEAIVSYKARKAKEIRIYESRIKGIKQALKYLDDKGFYIDGRELLGADNVNT